MALFAMVMALAVAGVLATPRPELALLPGAGLLGAVVLARRPEWALYAIVALIPYGAFRKIGGDVNLPWLFAAALLALLPLRVAMARRVPGLVPTLMWPLLLAYLGVNLVSALMSPFGGVARHELFLIAAAEMFVLLTMAFLPPEGLRHTLHRVVVWSVSGGALLGVLGFVFRIPAFGEDNPEGAAYRAIGGAIDPNNQAIMILFGLPLAVHLALHAESRRERWAMIGLCFVNVLGVMVTVSRSGFLMLCLTAAMLLWHYRPLLKPRRLGVMIAGGMMGLLVMVPMLPDSFLERQSSLAQWEDRSLTRRTSYLSVAADGIADRPLLGNGPGTFPELYFRSEVTRLYTSQVERMRREAHNTYLEVTVGSGFVGLALYLTILVTAWHHLRRAERAFRTRGERVMADQMVCWRIGFVVLQIFLLMLSDMYHKYMLLAVGLSQVALGVSGAVRLGGRAGQALPPARGEGVVSPRLAEMRRRPRPVVH